MRILLDTHILIWAITTPERLEPPARRHFRWRHTRPLGGAGFGAARVALDFGVPAKMPTESWEGPL